MNGLFRTAFIMLIICVAAVIIAAVVSYALDQTTIGLAISGVGSVLALVGIILASKSKPKPEPELLFHVSAGSFMPAPKVDSAVIRLNIRPEPPVETDEQRFFRVVKAAFSQRRKVISNSLSSGLGMDKASVIAALEQAGVSPTARAEALSLEDFAAVARQI